MGRKPDTRTAALLGIVRRELALTVIQAGAACGRSWVLVNNCETGNVRMGDEPCRRLICFYLEKLGSPAQQPMLPIPQMVEELARALVIYRARRAAELLASVDSGADALLVAVIRDGLKTERIGGTVVRRLKYRLASEERKREEEGAVGS